MARSGSWVKGLLSKGFIPEKLQPWFTNLVFAGFSVFLSLIYDGLSIVTQTQQRSFPIVHSQIRKLKHVGVLNQ